MGLFHAGIFLVQGVVLSSFIICFLVLPTPSTYLQTHPDEFRGFTGTNGTNGIDGRGLSIGLHANLTDLVVNQTQANHTNSGIYLIDVINDLRTNLSIPAGLVGNQTNSLIVYDGTTWSTFGSMIGQTGPQGPAGPPGANGTVGATGPAGANGTVGATGPAGANGTVGATGPAGANGTVGAPGSAGATGPAGITQGAKAFYSGADIVVAANVATTISWTNAGLNDGPMWSAGSPTQLTAAITGWYQLNWNIALTSSTTVSYFSVSAIYAGGSQLCGSAVNPITGGSQTLITGTCLVHMGLGTFATLQIGSGGTSAQTYTIHGSADSPSFVALLIKAG